MNTYTKNIVTIIIALGIFVIGDNIASAIWSQPTSAPPGGNVAAPVHTGDQGQIKTGPLQVTGLGAVGSGNAILVPNGRVGIGTVDPIAPLHVKSVKSDREHAPLADILIERASDGPQGPIGSTPRLGLTDTFLGPVETAPTWYIDNWADRFRIFRQPNNSSYGTEFMTVLKNGNVGIGTTNPQARLDVNGDIRGDISGLFYTKTKGNKLLLRSNGPEVFCNPGDMVVGVLEADCAGDDFNITGNLEWFRIINKNGLNGAGVGCDQGDDPYYDGGTITIMCLKTNP